MQRFIRPLAFTLLTCASLFISRGALAHDYAQMPTAELHHELDKRPMGYPIGVTIGGGIVLIAGGYLVLNALSANAVCQFNGQSCDNGTQIAVGAVMAGAGAVATTAGTIWLITWDQTRREISNEISRRRQSAGIGASPWFLEGGAGLRISARF